MRGMAWAAMPQRSACLKACRHTYHQRYSVLPDMIFVYQQKKLSRHFQAFLGKKSGANVSKLYVGSEDVIGRFLEGVLILKKFGSINLEFKNKDGCNILKS
jgi:hypothetical protein